MSMVTVERTNCDDDFMVCLTDVLGASDEQLIIEPVVDCCHRLGQFLTYIK